jgi:hypothetical protein
MAKKKKMTGSFCERTVEAASSFDQASFRWKKSGKSWVLTGCPRGDFARGRCRVGLRAHKLLAKAGRGRCKIGRKVKK